MSLMSRLLGLVLVCAASAVVTASQAGLARPRELTQAELFQPAKVWTATLTFTPDQWRGLEPTRGPVTIGGRFGGGEWLQGAEGHRNGWGVAQGIDFNYVHGDLEFDGRVFRDVAVRYKGNGTYINARGAGKFSFKIDLNKHVKGQKLAGVSTLNFHNNITDPSWMNEVVSYRLYREAGVPAPRSSYVRVYVTVTGQFTRRYAGLYTIAENVDTNFLQARFGSSAGAILKPVTVKPFADLGRDWARYVQTYDPKTDLTTAEQQRIMEFCAFVSRARDPEFAARIGEYVDLEAFARYFAVLVWINNIDSLLDRGQNYYVYLTPTKSQLIFIPWDQDHSFGRFSTVQSGAYESGNIYRPWDGDIKFLARMSAVPAFTNLYLARMREFSATIFKPERFVEQVNELARVIRPVVADEPNRVASFERAASGQSGLVPFTAARARSVVTQLSKQ